MPYNIQLTNGLPFASIAEGTVDNTSDVLTLPGKNKAGYGLFLNQNVVKMLENSAHTVAPTAPLVGQLWYDANVNQLKVWDSAEWKAVGATATAVEPPTPVVGDTWYNTTTNQLNVYNGTDYILVGGEEAPSTVETIDDNAAGTHTITKFYVDGTVVAIASADATFTVDPGEPLVATFPTLSPGIQVSSAAQFIGDATNALSLGGEPAANYLRSDVGDTMSGTLSIDVDHSMEFGAGADGLLAVAVDKVVLRNTTTNGDMSFEITDGVGLKSVMTIDGTSARARVASAPLFGDDIINLTYLESRITAANIKTLYETNANTNEYDDAEQTKLLGIEAGAEVNLTDVEIKNAYENGNYFNHPTNTTLLNMNYSQQTVVFNIALSLTAWNMLGGRKSEAILTNTSGGALNVSLDASWHSFGEASPISVPAGKALVLSMSSLNSAASGVYIAAVLEN